MKRSDMLDMIARTLKDIRMENYYDEKGSEWCANLILMEIEEKGMLPPNDGKKRAIKKTSVPCVVNAIKCYQWESEDE